jgi:ribonuclease Z
VGLPLANGGDIEIIEGGSTRSLPFLDLGVVMRPIFHPQLINGPFGDPALYVECMYQRRSLLFDAGAIQDFPQGKLLKISYVFISHAHMDHFIGFDHLIRLMLGRPKHLRVYGPAPFIDQVVHRLRSYSWNLVRGYEERLVLEVTQLEDHRMERVILDCGEGFRDPGERDVLAFAGFICQEQGFRVRAALLDHKIPSLAFCLEEPIHIQILKGHLKDWELTVGPWLRELKEAILRGEDDDFPVRVAPSHRGPMPLGWLRENLVQTVPGQRIGYVVDAGYGEANRKKIVSLVREADLLFIEAAFLQEDQSRAEATAHLTALQAGRLAAEARVAKVIPFHFSPKYTPDGGRLSAEVEQAFRTFGPTDEPR